MKKILMLIILTVAGCEGPDVMPTSMGGGTMLSDQFGNPVERERDLFSDGPQFPISFPRPQLHVKKGYNGIFYHGGPVMLGTTNVYYIWYGNWSGNTAQAILEHFAAYIGNTPYYNINTTYYDGNMTRVSNAVNFSASVSDNYSQGTSLTDSQIRSVVATAINTNKLPADTNGVYFVLTSADVNATSGFCTRYCGWHTSTSIAGKNIKYSFVGNGDRCPTSCTAQSTSPNNNRGADGMASVIAHELEEAATDPDINAWYDARGLENADKCAWTFGLPYTVSNGSLANMNLGGLDYLIQRNWVNDNGGYCALVY